jgi:hypothetical protein
MRRETLDLITRLGFWLVLALTAGGVAVQTTILLRRRRADAPNTFPRRWTSAQCRSVERFRMWAGLSLIPPWALLIWVIRWPVGTRDAVSLSLLLLMTQIWLSLLTPHDWDKLETVKNFSLVMAVLVGSWTTMLAVAIGFFLPS